MKKILGTTFSSLVLTISLLADQRIAIAKVDLSIVDTQNSLVTNALEFCMIDAQKRKENFDKECIRATKNSIDLNHECKLICETNNAISKTVEINGINGADISMTLDENHLLHIVPGFLIKFDNGATTKGIGRNGEDLTIKF